MPIEIQSEANLAVSYFRYKTQDNVKCDTGNTVQLFPAQVSLSTAYYLKMVSFISKALVQ